MLGQRLGRYEIVGKLGEGGMGVVWKARDHSLDRFVAIKVLPPGRATDADRRRFLLEAKSASALNHPNIVIIHEIFVENGQDVLVMELIKGRTLAASIPKNGLRLGEALQIAAQIADALASAHRAGIIHRDLKPGNIMINESGLVKVLDFGLAKLVDPPVGEQEETKTIAAPTEKGAILGTAAYMSPEQAEAATIDPRSDIFSFGAVFYEMLTGRRAFQGDSKMSTLASVLQKDPEPLGDQTPREVERLIFRCLRKEPSKRWQSMADLKLTLDDLREDTSSGKLGVAAPASAPRPSRWALAAALAALGVMIALGAWLLLTRRPASDAQFVPTPLTTLPGHEYDPAFSPDGNQVAFSWDGDKQDNYDIYVKLVGPGTPVRLTTDPAPDRGPAWSPDGRWIAFSRSNPNPGVYLIPALGGSERRLAGCRGGRGASASWTPDSKWIACGADGNPGLILLSPESEESRKLTAPPATAFDFGPALASDGRQLVFIRTNAGSGSELVTLPLSSGWKPSGEPHSLSPKRASFSGAAWIGAGQEVLYSVGFPSSLARFYRIPGAGGEPVMAAFAGEGAFAPAFSERSRRLAYSHDFREVNLYRLELDAGGAAQGSPSVVLPSSRNEFCQTYSPDGSRIAFESNRSGNDEIWTCNADGTNCLQLTSFQGPHAGSPAWSPDGRTLAFDGYDPQGRQFIFLIDSRGGQPRQLGEAQGFIPRWSRDGKWIYFSTRRKLWKIPSEGGKSTVAVEKYASASMESPDARYLYYSDGTAGERASLWRKSLSTGEESLLLPSISGRNFVATNGGIWFIAPEGSGHLLQYYDLASRNTRTVANISRKVHAGLTLSPDGRKIIHAQIDSDGADLMLVENFR